MHIGHLSTTVIGNCLRNVFNFLGYKTIAINYVGDYGTPFGKMITAYKLWGNEKDLNEKGVDYIQDLYVRFCAEAENDENLNEQARKCFALIEKKDKEVYPIYETFIEISKEEIKKIYKTLNISFDSWRGESYYSDKMEPVVEELEKKGLLKESDGAKIVDLTPFDLGVCLIKKSDGSSLYATRDLVACDDRFNNYGFVKSLYVTDVSQKLHFSQFFKVLELLGREYASGLNHVYYGRFSLPTGKIASRKGKQAILKDILDYSINKTKEIMKNNANLSEEEKNSISKSVGVGAVVFSAIKNEKIKDIVFDLDEALDFNGETSPYIQYTHARCCSIINKCKSDALNNKNFLTQNENLTDKNALKNDDSKSSNKKSSNIESNDIFNFGNALNDFDYEEISDATSYELIKHLNRFPETIKQVSEKFEPCLISRLLVDISKAFNKYYNSNRVIEDNGKVNTTRYGVVMATKIVLSSGLKLLGIESVEKM